MRKACLASPPTSPALSNSVHLACLTEGRSLLRRMCGSELNEALCEAILIPFKHDDVRIKVLRTALAAVGGNVRELLALKRALSLSNDLASATQCLNNMNNNTRIASLVLESPLGAWMNALAKNVYFEHATEIAPIVSTINAFIGAVFVEFGLAACRPLETELFGGYKDDEALTKLHARSKLQTVIQAVVKNRYNELLRLETKSLTPPSQAHNPRVEVTFLLAGTEIGRAVAKRKKDAVEQAATKALANPSLSEILDRLKHESDE